MNEDIVHRLVKEIDQGKDLEKVETGLKDEFGDEFNKVSGDVWNMWSTRPRWRPTARSKWCQRDKDS